MLIEQVKILYKRAPAAIPVNILIATILGVMLLPVVPSAHILIWWLILTAWNLFRFWHMRSVLKKKDFSDNPERLTNMFMLAAFIAGVIWIVAFLWFTFDVPDVYIIFIVFALGGMSVGAVASMVSMPRVFFAYVSPMIIPPIIVFLFQGNQLGFAMSSMILIYFLSISSTYMQSFQAVKESIQLQIDNEELIQNLKCANQRLEIANHKILALSLSDELTQLANRRQLDNILEKEWSRAIRSQLPLSLIMFDIDYFKDYNDAFGHQQGDICLQKMAETLHNVFKRPGDCVARYGGEEFLAILPDTSLEGAMKMAEKVAYEINNLHIIAGNTKVSPFVTLSMGVASILPSQEDEMSHLVTRADAALYRAKELGRNRIEQDDQILG